MEFNTDEEIVRWRRDVGDSSKGYKGHFLLLSAGIMGL